MTGRTPWLVILCRLKDAVPANRQLGEKLKPQRSMRRAIGVIVACVS
jgi:hypothetical protein